MKLLFDHNLSYRLVPALASLYPGSMHVRDVSGDRWQRSTRFLRVLGESLRWTDDPALEPFHLSRCEIALRHPGAD